MSNDGYNVNPPAPENIRPTEPPKAPPLPSEVKELKDKIRQLQENQFMTGTVILHQIARKVRACDFLDDEQKDELIKLFWRERVGSPYL